MTSNQQDGPAATERLASFISGLDPDTVPAAVAESGKLRILDILGICIAARDLDGPTATERLAQEWGGRTEAHCVGSELRVPAATAALVNGTRAHALDFDDTHHASRVHPSSVIVPTVLAVGEREGASGRDVVAATVVGLEVLVRVGLVAPGRLHERGLHATSVCGVLGAAASASRLLGWDASTTSNALGVSASTASGLREAYLGVEATDTKAFHAGWAAHAGVVSAQLAGGGLCGPRTALEGRFGYYNAYVSPDEWDLSALTDGLGSVWHTPEIVFKLYPCGSLIHASIDAALSIRREHALAVEEIEEVTVVVPPGMVSTVCEPLDQKLDPSTGYQAKFSAQYAVAVALYRGRVTEASFSEEQIHDPGLRDLLSRVRYESDASLPFPEKYPGGVRIRTRSGMTHEVLVSNSPGSVERPVAPAELEGKFLGNVRGRLPAEASQEVIERVLHLEAETDVGPLMRALSAGAAS